MNVCFHYGRHADPFFSVMTAVAILACCHGNLVKLVFNEPGKDRSMREILLERGEAMSGDMITRELSSSPALFFFLSSSTDIHYYYDYY